MPSHKVIVFGPTGDVGSSTALVAAELGASVVLAMRDTKKPIRGLDPAREQQLGFQRVQADLTKPDTVSNAVTSTGAKIAFIYLAYASTDHMRSTIEALKSAGVELVVFLSSFTVEGDLKAIPPDEVIPWVHAQVEISLQEVFGREGFVSIRPAAFASNTLQYKKGLNSGLVKVLGPNFVVDCIVPKDIGRVCGRILANGLQDDNRSIYLYGPQFITQKQTAEILVEKLGKKVDIQDIASEEEAYKILVEEGGYPKQFVKYMIEKQGLVTEGEDNMLNYSKHKEDRDNVQKYSGTRATTFVEWIEQNKALFDA